MKIIIVKCDECGTDVCRELKEYKRSLKLKRKNFCNNKCSAQYSNRLRMERGEIFALPPEFIGKGSKKTKFSIFKPLLKRIQNRKNKKEISITLEDVAEIWEKQKGVCIYTKMKLTLPEWYGKKTIYTASMDRIDPNKGYTKDNCQIVSIMANFAKNDFSDEDMKEFCKQIKMCL
jgi:hypothetical protein